MRTTFRHGDKMLSVESRPAEIDFSELLEATEIEDDDHYEAPWDNRDGYDHNRTPVSRLHDNANYTEMQGYTSSHYYRENFIVAPKDGEDWGLYEYMRQRGASRQVAAEAVAAQRRRIIAQLVQWLEHGWQWYCVTCNYEVLGEEYINSLGGIDDYDYARELKEEVALEVARELEEAGYTVTGKPDAPGCYNRADKQAELRRKLALHNWSA